MPDALPDGRVPTIAEAFAAMPLETPDRSAWPALSERIAAAERARTRPAPRRWPLLLATAAALALVALIPRLDTSPAGVPASPVAQEPAAAAPLPLDTLMAESARLEHLIAAVDDEAMATASTTALSLEIEDRVRGIDVALVDPSLQPVDRARLWQRRVELLRDYAGLLGTTQMLAADGGRYDGDLVAVY